MPIYEFSCQDCGKKFEELVFDETIPPCPECGSHKTKKLVCACARQVGKSSGNDYAAPISGGCAGCSGGNCAGCGR